MNGTIISKKKTKKKQRSKRPKEGKNGHETSGYLNTALTCLLSTVTAQQPTYRLE